MTERETDVDELTVFDQDLRGRLTRTIAEIGRAPSNAELAAAAGVDESAVEDRFSAFTPTTLCCSIRTNASPGWSIPSRWRPEAAGW